MIKRIKVTILGVLIVLTIQACVLPFVSSPTPFAFPTPDLTLTAIYSVLNVLTATPPSALTATSTSPLPNTATPVIPTETSALPAVTATSVPSITPAPTSTPANLLIRSGASVTANFLSHPPVIDGNLGDWNLNNYPVKNVVYGASNWSGTADLSANVMIGWDDTYLYLGANVTNDVYVQNAFGDNLYKGDSLEILLDTNLAGDFYIQTLSPDDFQLGISPGSPSPGDHPEAYLWFPRTIKGNRPQVKIAAQKVSGGYTVEAAIPWSILEMTPQQGKYYGFAFSVSDNDKVGYSVQQSMVSNVPNRHLTIPTTWGDLLLNAP